MSEFIGSRISLVSRSDIRYVGTLHEINSESSTVALEQVVSYGTEGRRNNPEDEVAPSDSVYEYIVFRGSDVKDLRIEETPKETKPPQVPDDPAILGSGTRPSQPTNQAQGPPPPQPQPQHQQQQQQSRPPQPPQFQNQQQYPFFYPPPPGQRFGPHGGPPPGPGFPGMPYGAPPPGWFPPGQGFPQHPGAFPNQQMQGPPGGPPQDQGAKQPQPAPIGPSVNNEQKSLSQKQLLEKQAAEQTSSKAASPGPSGTAKKGPPPHLETKPDVATALAPPAPPANQTQAAPKPGPTGPKNGRIMPAIPLPSPKPKSASAANGMTEKKPEGAAQPSKPQQVAANAALQNATEAATAAVAAAMAKLPPAPVKKPQQGNGAMDNLTQKVNEMRTNDGIRSSRQPGTGGYAAGHRGGRGRGGAQQNQTSRVEVPATDFDFESANAKFSKQDLIKEAIATGSPVGTPEETPAKNGFVGLGDSVTSKDAESVTIPPAGPYNRSSSFFDNISSESKDREDTEGKRLGGREWRGEEQKKNVETFGQGTVDNGYRGGGHRGRSRGRGYGYRGRGNPTGARGGRGGGFRGGRGSNQSVVNGAASTAT